MLSFRYTFSNDGVPIGRPNAADRLRIALNNPVACAEFCRILRNTVIVHPFGFDLNTRRQLPNNGIKLNICM